MVIGIAGAGRVAQALGRRLRESGANVAFVASRSGEHARAAAAFIGGDCRAVSLNELACRRMILAVSDSAIREVADQVPRPEILLHTCGAHGAELLERQRAGGVDTGSLHPLQTFASAEAGYRVLPGSAFAIDGEEPALRWAEEITAALGGTVLRIPAASRTAYHAAAVMASNGVTALLDGAEELLQLAGVPEKTAREALGPLTRAAFDNALADSPQAALTGPVERGDLQTVMAHLRAIASASESVQGLYRAASLQALDIASRRGLSMPIVSKMREELENRV